MIINIITPNAPKPETYSLKASTEPILSQKPVIFTIYKTARAAVIKASVNKVSL